MHFSLISECIPCESHLDGVSLLTPVPWASINQQTVYAVEKTP